MATIADGLVVLSLVLSVVAACLLAYDAIWAQGARFQRDMAAERKASLENFFIAQEVSANSLPDPPYSAADKQKLIDDVKSRFAPDLAETERELQYWEDHPARVQRYSLIGILAIVVSSLCQGTAYFLK